MMNTAKKSDELSALAGRLEEQWAFEAMTPEEQQRAREHEAAAEFERAAREREAAMTPEKKAARRDYYRARRAEGKTALKAARFYKF